MPTTAWQIMSTLNVRPAQARVQDVLSNAPVHPVLVVDEQRRPMGLVPPEILANAPGDASLIELASELPAVTLVGPDVSVEALIAASIADADVAWFVVCHCAEYVGAVRPSFSDLLRPGSLGANLERHDVFGERMVFHDSTGTANLRIGGLYGEIEVDEGKVSFHCRPDPPDSPHSYPLGKARRYYNDRKRVICPLHHREMVRRVHG